MIELIQHQDIRRRRRRHIFRIPDFAFPAGAGEALLKFGKKISFTPETAARWSAAAGGLLAAAAFVFSLLPGFTAVGDGPVELPGDDQLQMSMIEYLESSNGVGGAETSGELPPLASFLGGIDEDVYTLEPGDTLSEVALKYGVDVGTLISYNNIDDVRRISAGSRLKIPSFDGVRYVVRPGDSLSRIAAANAVDVNAILDANNLESALIQPGDTLFLPGASISEYEYKKATGTLIIYPTTGRLTSRFGYRNDPFTGLRRYHYGIDLANGTGTAIIAAMDGVVVDVENRPAGYGNYVVVRHERGYQTLYGHMDTIAVREGQRVRQGQNLGTMGNTGRSTGPHLHFAIYKNNRPVDPLTLLH